MIIKLIIISLCLLVGCSDRNKLKPQERTIIDYLVKYKDDNNQNKSIVIKDVVYMERYLGWDCSESHFVDVYDDTYNFKCLTSVQEIREKTVTIQDLYDMTSPYVLVEFMMLTDSKFFNYTVSEPYKNLAECLRAEDRMHAYDQNIKPIPSIIIVTKCIKK